MEIEIWMLLGSAALGLVHVSGQSFALKLAVGNRWTVGARDESVDPGPVAGRWQRALDNFLETFPLFAAVLLLALITERTNAFTAYGALLYFFGRVAYLPAYLSGVSWVRTFIWQFSMIGFVLVGVGVGIHG